MVLYTRLCLVLGSVIAVAALVLWADHHAADLLLRDASAHERTERQAMLARAVELQRDGSQVMVGSYSWWDEMVHYVNAPTAAWATENIDNMVGVPNGGDAVWAFDADWKLLHAIDQNSGPLAPPFTSPEAVGTHVGKRFEFQYFTVIDDQLWEILGAAIQSPEFWRHETPVEGYLLLGQKWNPALLARLGGVVRAQLQLRPATDPEPTEESSRFRMPLRGLDGTTLFWLEGRADMALANQVHQREHHLLLLFALCLLGAIAITTLALGRWVFGPLAQLNLSLETRSPVHLTALLPLKTNFGEMARLIASQFRQGRMLQDEIRRHAETNSERRGPNAETNTELRVRLAASLHDGPMQTLYGVALQLSLLEERARAGQSPIAPSLAEIRDLVTNCGSDLRALLMDMEPADLRDIDLESALERLERYLHAVSPQKADLHVQEGSLDGLTSSAHAHIYYICRELASNAARHARPKTCELRFHQEAGFLVIEWRNDGVIAEKSGRAGDGLRNIANRAESMNGTFEYKVTRGGGWRALIELPYTSLTSDGPKLAEIESWGPDRDRFPEGLEPPKM